MDFITGQKDHSRMLIQVCESMTNPQTRKREIAALTEAMAEMKISSSTIVTQHEEDRIQVASGIIDVLPAWRFLLSLPETP